MATKAYLRVDQADAGTGINNTRLAGTNSGWVLRSLSLSPGSSAVSKLTDTVNGPTSGLEFGLASADDAFPNEWVSPPLAVGVTISGTITFNLWGLESNMANNAGFQVIVQRYDSQMVLQETVVNSERGVELATAAAVNSWTATPTSTVFNKGDRIRVVVAVNDIGTMVAAAGGATLRVGGPTTGADGDSYIQFTEAITFASAPAGSQLFLTDLNSTVSAGSATEKDLWTDRGSGVVQSITNSSTGWHSPTQITASAGGTALEWFSRQLNAFTLAGIISFNLRVSTTTSTLPSFRVEVAICNADGSLISIWGAVTFPNYSPLVSTTETAFTINVSGADIAIADGQRIRVRIYEDDSSHIADAAGALLNIFYAGTSVAATGDSYVTLPQAVTEFIPPSGVPEFQPLLMKLVRMTSKFRLLDNTLVPGPIPALISIDYVDSVTIASVTSPTTTEATDFVDSATIAAVTAPTFDEFFIPFIERPSIRPLLIGLIKYKGLKLLNNNTVPFSPAVTGID